MSGWVRQCWDELDRVWPGQPRGHASGGLVPHAYSWSSMATGSRADPTIACGVMPLAASAVGQTQRLLELGQIERAHAEALSRVAGWSGVPVADIARGSPLHDIADLWLLHGIVPDTTGNTWYGRNTSQIMRELAGKLGKLPFAGVAMEPRNP